ncbi:hypothetical protein H0E84_04785 [Luteimonas sp. SJ-92]|uniref:Uncharacterized protein n=1 Tax=Luteimonas salinisoli TaxID=2752307 RepID=A0A853JAN1_9GAMM|nr:hypothetical protein [Luteimonas salinisoli]NZA25690.1 hypothetical protein [Luteimonas salinisoli]
MSQIYGVDSQTYHRLPADDQNAIRQSWQQRQDEAPATPATSDQAAPEAPQAPPPADPAQATTAEEAVAAIHAMPLPDTSDLSQPPLRNLPEADRQSIVDSRNASFNQSRAEAAEAALERLEPQRSDFDVLPGATADHEYQQARQAYDSSPYVQELERIVEEATTAPNEIPAYLETGTSSSDVNAIPLPQARGALAMLGIELPESATPEQIAAGYEILATVPNDILGPLINPGYSVGYSADLGGLGTTQWLPVRGEATATLEGEVSLSEVRTGVGFEQTQRFEATVEIRGEAGVDLGKTPLQRIYGWAERLGALPDGARDLANSSPLLRGVMRGLPVSGEYQQFAGTRLSYEAVVTPGQGAELDGGELSALPNPLDPMGMPTGTSLLIRGQSLEGSSFEANYKAFTLGSTHTELSGLGFGVTRQEGSIVEVYAGPVDTVENEMFFGIGRQGVAAIGIGSEYSSETREMEVARIDLSTAEGQAAYQEFITSGRVPDWAPPGVPQSGTTSIYDGEHASFIGIQLGGLDISTGGESQISVRDTSWDDGTIDRQLTYSNSGGLTTDVRFQVAANGEPDFDQAQWTVVRADLDPVLASYLEASYDGAAGNRELDGDHHVQMTFTTDELMAMHERGRASVLEGQGQEKLDNLDAGIETPWWSSTDERLAVATTPDEVFAILSDDVHGGAVIEDLLALSITSGEPTTGTFRMEPAG